MEQSANGGHHHSPRLDEKVSRTVWINWISLDSCSLIIVSSSALFSMNLGATGGVAGLAKVAEKELE